MLIQEHAFVSARRDNPFVGLMLMCNNLSDLVLVIWDGHRALITLAESGEGMDSSEAQLFEYPERSRGF